MIGNLTVPDDTKPSLLVVDDDEGLLFLMSQALEAEGYRVGTAGSGAEAQNWLSKNSADLMLLDLKMKDVGGAALVKRLRRDDMPIPFIVVTGQGDEKIAAELMKQGALDYVMKDTGMLDLLPSIVKRAWATVVRDRELAAAQARFAAAVRATNDGVWELLIPETRVHFSTRWKAILGYETSEIADQFEEWEKRVHPSDLVRIQNAQKEFFEGDESVFRIEYRLRHRDGAYRWILSRAFLERDSAGRPLRMTLADADITDRKELEKEILRISDREQWRIGQELHDNLGQQLTAIELMCESLKSDLQEKYPTLADQPAKMGAFLREAILQTRALAHGLTAFRLDADGLELALQELCSRTDSLGRARCRFVCEESVTFKDSEAAGHLFRIAQEAVNNAVKHATAREIVVTLSANQSDITLTIADDGKGMPKSHRPRGGRGMGLQVMQHRANAIGAELHISSREPKGTVVECTVRRTL